MRDACTELDILFVADEVITGFGRTGPLFACEEEDVSPDLMTVAKGLTAGYIPMGAVHRLANRGCIPLEVIEVQTGSYLGEDDIVRLDDEYDRS